MKKSKIRVIVNGISFYTTHAAIKRGVGDSSSVNVAVRQVYDEIMSEGILGRLRTVSIYNHRMEKESLNVQISL